MRICLRSVVVFCSFYLATEHVQGGLIYAQYDDFNDNSIDSGKWNVLGGEVTESDGRLNVWMNRNGHFFDTDHSMITSEGKVGGEDIFGFRLNSDRIPARRAGPGDAEAALGITDGTNSITINWLNDVNQFILRATGVYGSGDIYRWDPDAPGPAEQPDGPLEIRDNGDNSITVLHNNSPEYTFGGISIQSNIFLLYCLHQSQRRRKWCASGF